MVKPDQLNRMDDVVKSDRDVDVYFMKSSLWPAILYTAVLMVVGTIGNVLVLIVYRHHFQTSVTRMFIYALAILDLGNCCITMPTELAILIHFTTFPSPLWCKLTRYLTYTFNGTSSFVLIAIALDRYFKVCWPMKCLITVRRAKIICVTSFFLTAILAIPAWIIYGELTLPISVSDGHISILPAKQSTKPHSIKMDSKKIVSGHMCLLNSEHVDGKLPMSFYAAMFSLYLVMVFLVVFFYGKVAKTMFALTSKHSQMFSFNTHKSRTPSSNSFVPERSHDNSHRSKCDAKDEVSSADNKTKGSSGTSPYPKAIGNEGCSDHKLVSREGCPDPKTVNHEGCLDLEINTLTVQFIKSLEDRAAVESAQIGNTGETGYETGDTNSNSETRDGVDGQFQENVKSKKMMTGNSELKSVELDTSTTKSEIDNQAGDCKPDSTNSKESSPQGLVINSHSEETNSEHETNPKSPNKRDKKQKKSSKIPKIKVKTASEKDSDIDDISYSQEYGQPDLTLHPLSTNQLLIRRIKSADNVSHLSRLQIPDGGLRSPRFPDASETNNSKAIRKSSYHRDKYSAIGKVNLDYQLNNTNPDVVQEKTITLTKLSSSGKTKRCVLPLRGMSTRTASQAKEHQEALTAQNIQAKSASSLDSSQGKEHQDATNVLNIIATSVASLKSTISERQDTANTHESLKASHKGLDISYENDVFQCNLRQEPSNQESEIRLMKTQSSPSNLNSPDLDSVVTLRTKSPDIVKDVPHHDESAKCVQITVPRKEIISAADILQEQHRRSSLHPFRTSRILFIISLVFVISFVPFFVIALTRSSVGSSFMSVSDIELGVISIFIRSSLISNAVNPIAYGLLSTHFRRECADIISRIFRR